MRECERVEGLIRNAYRSLALTRTKRKETGLNQVFKNNTGTTKEEILMRKVILKVILLLILLCIFPGIAYAHGGHSSVIMQLKGLWDVVRLKYWGAITCALVFVLAVLIIFFVVKQIQAKRQQGSSPPA